MKDVYITHFNHRKYYIPDLKYNKEKTYGSIKEFKEIKAYERAGFVILAGISVNKLWGFEGKFPIRHGIYNDNV